MTNLYAALKKWQLVKGYKHEHTHTGLPPTAGRWFVTDDDMNEYLKLLAGVKGRWAITELAPKDRPTGMVFDVDIKIAEDACMDAVSMNFATVLRDVLIENTDTYDDFRGCPPEMWILRKPCGTPVGDVFKCGFKVMMPLDRATPEDNATIAIEMRSRMDQWLVGIDTLNGPEDIVDTTIYTNRLWLLLGSVKENQTSGGYSVWKVLRGQCLIDVSTPTEADPDPLIDLTDVDNCRRHLSRLTCPDDSSDIHINEDSKMTPACIGRPGIRVGATDGTAAHVKLRLKPEQRVADHLKSDPEIKVISDILDMSPVEAIDDHKRWNAIMQLLKSECTRLVYEMENPDKKKKKKKRKKSKSKKSHKKRGRTSHTSRYECDTDTDSDSDSDDDTNEKLDANLVETKVATLKYLAHVYTARSTKYTDDKWFLDTWDNRITPLKTPPDSYMGEIVKLVIAWRAKSDNAMNNHFLRSVYRLVIRPKENTHKECYNNRKAAAYDYDKADTDFRKGKIERSELDKACDYWRRACDAEDDLFHDIHECTKPAVFRYMSTFLTLLTVGKDNEVVSAMFEPQMRGKAQKLHVMTQWIRIGKNSWKDMMTAAGCGEFATEWLKSGVPMAKKYDLDPSYQHYKGSGRLNTPDGNAVFNVFCGFKIDSLISPNEAKAFKFDQDKVDEVNELLDLLVNHDKVLREYILRWIAAPLQRRGYRTGVMVIMTSLQHGVGKGLFFDQLLGSRIYGTVDSSKPFRHAAAAQIKDINHVVGNFNEGILMKFFLQLDECGIWDKAVKQNEMLKGLITEETVTCNQKHLSLISFKNFMNMLLNTNKEDPIIISPGDRRFVIVSTMLKMAQEWYKEKAAKILSDEYVKHWYAHLMQLDMGDFYDSKPPITNDKRFAMNKNMPPEFRFIQAMYERFEECESTQETVKGNFMVHPTALKRSYAFYNKQQGINSVSFDKLVDIVKQHLYPLVTTKKSELPRMKYNGERARGVVFPDLGRARAHLNTIGYWSEDTCGRELVRNTDYDRDDPTGATWAGRGDDLYKGGGVKALVDLVTDKNVVNDQCFMCMCLLLLHQQRQS
ncbi:hypothetical protein JKP88DRAFT_248920 [Tribonema minus]|uniref:Uncharacterized protein n=1 Tax=Tribonema minus TaxID=303371 RepID=A0A836C966_9STRA|nr:hypothetical protein JKP88DRAFT_248920 [Tribonema minus]